MTTSNETTPAPLRVLVVENDPQWRADHLNNLKRWGYAAWAAEPAEDATDQFQSLWDDAIAKAGRNRCHLALVDMRLKNDDDSNDTSGLKLVPHLAPTVSIIISGYGDLKAVRAALKSSLKVPERAYDFVGKEDGPHAVQLTMEKAKVVIDELEETLWNRRPLQIVWPSEGTTSLIIDHLFPNDQTISPDELNDLLRLLFPRASRLRVENLQRLERPLNPLRQKRHFVVQVLEDDFSQPWIARIGPAGSFGKEFENFAMVEGYFQPARYAAVQTSPISLWHLSGVVYRLVGSKDLTTQAVSFPGYFTAHRVSEIEQVLTRLINLLRPLYMREPRDAHSTLFEAYSKVLGWDWYKSLLENWHGLVLSLPESLPGIDNPIAWLVKRLRLSGTGGYRDTTPSSRLGLVHGNLNGDNIFVDEHSDVWLIDFGKTGVGPILYDFAELEFEIVTRLAGLENESAQFSELLLAILEPSTSRSPIASTSLVVNSARARKALSVIVLLRQLARDVVGNFDQQEYLWALLLHSLYHLPIWQADRSVESENSPTNHAYVLAAMICHRLENWDSAWPPRQWEFSGWVSGQVHADTVRFIDTLYAQRDGLEYQLEVTSLSDKQDELRRQIKQVEQQLLRYGETLLR